MYCIVVVDKQNRWLILTNQLKQVYESELEGVVCYQDEHGEIICEGYDEGPCFQRISKPTYYQYPIPPRFDSKFVLF